MKKTTLIQQYRGPNICKVGQIALLSPLNEKGIGGNRYHHPYVDTGKHSRLQGCQYGFVWHEIRCLDIYVFAGAHDYAKKTVHDFRIWGDRSARHNLRYTVVDICG